MARPNAELEPRLPREHLSVFTWIALVAIAAVVLTLVVWAVWFAGPTMLR